MISITENRSKSKEKKFSVMEGERPLDSRKTHLDGRHFSRRNPILDSSVSAAPFRDSLTWPQDYCCSECWMHSCSFVWEVSYDVSGHQSNALSLLPSCPLISSVLAYVRTRQHPQTQGEALTAPHEVHRGAPHEVHMGQLTAGNSAREWACWLASAAHCAAQAHPAILAILSSLAPVEHAPTRVCIEDPWKPPRRRHPHLSPHLHTRGLHAQRRRGAATETPVCGCLCRRFSAFHPTRRTVHGCQRWPESPVSEENQTLLPLPNSAPFASSSSPSFLFSG